MDVICPQPVSESYAITISEFLLQGGYAKNENSPPASSLKLRPFNGMTQERYSPVKFRRRVNAEFFSTRSSDFPFLPSAQGIMLPPRRQATTPNSCNLSFLKEISKLSQMNLSRLAPSCSYQMLESNENADLSRPESTNKSRYSSSVLREVSSLVNTPLTPSDAAKLVYLEGEEAPICGDFPIIHEKLRPNRRSYPLANDANLHSPESPCSEITWDYASCENIHKPFSNRNGVGVRDSTMSFSNPNYLSSAQKMEEKIGRGDYVKLNNPADCLLEDAVELAECRLEPPKSLPLCTDNFDKVREKRKKYRACSAGRYNRQSITSVCIFLVGGKEPRQITSFKKPISLWKLSLTKDVY